MTHGKLAFSSFPWHITRTLRFRINPFFVLVCLSLHSAIPHSTRFFLPAWAEEINLPPIIKEGTEGNLFEEDWVVPAFEGKTFLTSEAGSIQNSIQNQVAIPITDYGRAGGISQVRGFGFSAEDVDAQFLGVSLNPPQGGGYDLSSFPQYLWSGYRYQMGPTLNGLNQSASSGTLSLVPWTDAALNSSESGPGLGARAVGLVSSLGMNQISAGVKDGKHVAVVAGYSVGTIRGPGAGLSSRWGSGRYTGSIHLLASHLEVRTSGPNFDPTPQATTSNVRFIPLLQNDFRVGTASLLKTAIFYDWGHLGYRDPEHENEYQTHYQQWGAQSVYLVEQWKWSLSVKQMNFEMRSFSDLHVPLQTTSGFQVSRGFEWGSAWIEPTLQAVGVTDFGFIPQGSLGVRKEWDQGRRVAFARGSLSERVPTLMDRRAVSQDFIGNPSLRSERDWTGILGVETKTKEFSGTLQSFAQLKQNARVFVGNTVNNLNNAYVLALTGTGNWPLTQYLDTFCSGTLSQSRLMLTGHKFPFVPGFLAVSGLNFHSSQKVAPWEAGVTARFSGPQVTDAVSGQYAASYLTFNFNLQVEVSQGLQLTGRVDNVFDRTIEVIRGYPIGRSFSLALAGEIQ